MRIAVVGLGHIGLPLAVQYASRGHDVLGVDVASGIVEAINRGESPHRDEQALIDGVPRLVAEGRLRAATWDGAEAMREADAVVVIVPVVVDAERQIDYGPIDAATRDIARRIGPDVLVVYETTLPVGTTRDRFGPVLVEGSGLELDRNLFLAFSPERVDPGNERYHTRNTPKVVGGITEACRQVCCALYQPAIDSLVPVSSTEAAELVKLLENTFRSVNIGLVNEMAIVCEKLGVNVWEVIDAAATKPFGFMKFTPGPGLGGHCIPIDPHYLAWKMRGLNYKTRFIDIAGEVNTEMPVFWVRQAIEALNRHSRSMRGSRVLVLGVAYKKDIDDMRESPALDIIRLLEQQGAQVSYHDPHVTTFSENGHEFHSVPLTEDLVAGADCVVVVTDHTAIDFAMVKRKARLVVDTRNALGRLA